MTGGGTNLCAERQEAQDPSEGGRGLMLDCRCL